MSEFLRQTRPLSGSEEPLPSFPFMKRDAYVIYSPIKPPVKMLLWNTQTLDHVKRELNRWLDGEIVDGEKIVKIERKVMVVGPREGRPTTCPACNYNFLCIVQSPLPMQCPIGFRMYLHYFGAFTLQWCMLLHI